MTAFRNIITPEFYTFLMSNKKLYGRAVFDQINDASEKIAITEDEQDSLAVVLSGEQTGITTPSNEISYLPNQPKLVTYGDGLKRRKIKFRSIDGMQYSDVMKDFTGLIKSPLDQSMPAADRDYYINLHPSAHTIVGEFQTNPMPFGSIVIVRKIGTEFVIIENVSSPMISSNPSGDTGESTEYSYDSSKDGDLERKFNLKRRKGKYTGKLTQYHNQMLYNGSLPTDMLRVPDTTHWKPMGSGGGAILIDYIPSFHAMCAAFYNHFGKKLRSSGIRSFKQQIKNRKLSMPVSAGGSRPESAACKTLNQRGAGCGTAVPGRSNHGWGQAVDIRTPEGVKCTNRACFIGASSPYYKWLVDNAYTNGFEGMKWGHLGQKGTILASQTFEAWHWEPITGRVIKGL